MKKGISQESKELRRHLLSQNGPDMVERMQQSGLSDPVGLIIEMTDDIGRQLTYAALEKQGMSRREIPESHCVLLQERHPNIQVRCQLRNRHQAPAADLRNRRTKPQRPQTPRPALDRHRRRRGQQLRIGSCGQFGLRLKQW